MFVIVWPSVNDASICRQAGVIQGFTVSQFSCHSAVTVLLSCYFLYELKMYNNILVHTLRGRHEPPPTLGPNLTREQHGH